MHTLVEPKRIDGCEVLEKIYKVDIKAAEEARQAAEAKAAEEARQAAQAKAAEAARQARVVMPWHPVALPQLCI